MSSPNLQLPLLETGILPALPEGFLYIPDFLSRQWADELLVQLLQETFWSQPRIRVYGQWHPIPRLQAWMGDPGSSYTYSGLVQTPLPWHPAVALLNAELTDTPLDIGAALPPLRFNSVLLNCYRDGKDAMGWHSDDEAELGPTPVIASISLGEPRRFALRRKGDSKMAHAWELAHGSLLIMYGNSQRDWQHAVPRSARHQQSRINLTFRTIHPSLHGSGQQSG